jgi:arginase family enzyme
VHAEGEECREPEPEGGDAMPKDTARRIVRLIGLPTDINSSFLRGPALAPRAIREALGVTTATVPPKSAPASVRMPVLPTAAMWPCVKSPPTPA